MVTLLLIVLVVLALVGLLAHKHHADELSKLRGEFDTLERWIADKLRHGEATKP